MSRFRFGRYAAGAALLSLAVVACVPETPPASTTPTTVTPTTVAPTTTIPEPVFEPAVTFTSTTGLAQIGSTVTVEGSGFDPSKVTPPGTPVAQAVAGVYVAIGIGEGPIPTAYASAKYIRPNFNGAETNSGANLNEDGTFSATIATPALFSGQDTAVNCYIDDCKIFVWSAHYGTVAEWTFSAPATFAAATEKQVVLSQATSIPNAGKTITVTGAGFPASAPGIYVGQVPWTDENKPADWNTNAAAWGDTQFLPFPVSLKADGTFRTTLNAVADLGDTDCATDGCSVITVKAHGQADPTGGLTSWTPITFAAPAA